MALVSGSNLGPYEISGPLAAGGMGEVYRAHDTRLGRDVAIKVLPESFAHDPERRARFEREARVLAGLSHPHIAVVHGFEPVAAEGSEQSADALVMELVEGPTLAERLECGPLAVEEALGIARQIAAALEAAHEHGVVHRDLKPSNVKLRPDGTVKVLDFGLAKAFAGDTPSREPLHSRTLSMAATGVGQVLGTAAYMPPEQARGNGVDRSVDLWAFGCVLYEMLAGQRAFPGEDPTDIIAAVLKSNPDWTQLPAETPATVRMLLRQCLRKQPRERLGDARAARLMLEDAGAEQGVAHEPAGRPAPYRRALVSVLAGIAIAASGAFLVERLASGPTPDAAQPVRFDIVPAGPHPPSLLAPRSLAIAPDGSHVAYAAGEALWMHSLAQGNAIALNPDRREPFLPEPFFSPDGAWVATLGGGALRKMPVAGGAAVTLAGEDARTLGGTWSADDTLVFATALGLFRVPAAGGAVERLLTPAPDLGEVRFGWPELAPDGRHVAFTILRGSDIDSSDIAVLDLVTQEYRVTLRGGFAARYVPTGHLVYAVNRRLRAVAVDESFEVLGDPLPIAGVELPPGLRSANFDISANGTLVYMVQGEPASWTMVWVDRDGREEAVQANPGNYLYPRISPDGSRVALEIAGASRDIWIFDLERGGMTRLTDGPTEELMSAWSADGRRVFFASDAEGPFKVYSRAADASSPAQLELEGAENYMPLSAADPARLVVRIHTPPAGDVAILHLDEPRRLEPLLESSRYNIVNAQVSPDGGWIAYQSDESGQNEVYVRSFPDIDRRRELVSRGGGTQPLWGPSGSGELYYRTLGGGVAAVAVELEPDLSVGVPRELFPNRGYGISVGNAWNYAVSPRDGRFLMVKGAGAAPVPPIRVVVNWIEELKRQIAAR